MKPIRYFKGVRLVVKPVTYHKTKLMLSYVKDKRLWPSGVRPIGSECMAYVDGHEGPIMASFAAANTQCEADQRARFYARQHLNKRMKKHKPTIRSTVKGEYHATMYHDGAYHHGFGVTIEAAVENAKYNIENFGKVLDELIEDVEKPTKNRFLSKSMMIGDAPQEQKKQVPWYKRWFN